LLQRNGGCILKDGSRPAHIPDPRRPALTSTPPNPPTPNKMDPDFDEDILTWDELVSGEDDEEQFLLRPYIPQEGIVLLYGTTSLGKSPLCWQIAYCIGEGVPFFGLPVKKGKVLFLEMDSTRRGSRPRLKRWGVEGVTGVTFCFLQGFTAPHPTPALAAKIMKAIRRCGPGGPDLVIINSLRKFHGMDDKDSATVKAVYDWGQMMFPRKALLFVHHEVKTPRDPKAGGLERERFSGSNAWLNDAQIGLHLRSQSGDPKANLALWHVKSQESELFKPLRLRLAKNGTHLTCPLFEEHTITSGILADSALSAREKDEKIALALNCSERKAREQRLYAEANPQFDLLTKLGRSDDDFGQTSE
jgi:hypothetical protein